jgi:hypothetical protein
MVSPSWIGFFRRSLYVQSLCAKTWALYSRHAHTIWRPKPTKKARHKSKGSASLPSCSCLYQVPVARERSPYRVRRNTSVVSRWSGHLVLYFSSNILRTQVGCHWWQTATFLLKKGYLCNTKTLFQKNICKHWRYLIHSRCVVVVDTSAKIFSVAYFFERKVQNLTI